MAGAQSTLILQLLGTPRWQHGAAAAPLSRIDAALLALVALPGEAPRDRVAGWLWPDASLANANTNLRQHVFKLRQASGHALLVSGGLLRLAEDVATDRLQVPPPWEGELLGGFDYGDLAELDRWVVAERERLKLERAEGLAAAASRLEHEGALAAAIEHAMRAVTLVPTQEHAWRRLMRLHYLRGDRSAAVAAFERFEHEICREYGLVPASETLDLLRTIEHGAAARPVGRVPLPAELLRPPRLIGRDRPWHLVQAAWAAGRAVLLLGEGGIGKSRLASELLAAEPGGPRAGLAGHARPGDAAMPYAPWTPLLAEALARFEPELTAPDREALAHVLPGPDSAAQASVPQTVLWRAVESLLAACVPRGLAVLSLDDLHLADPASLELARWLVASPQLASLRWLLCARPDEPGPAGPVLTRWLGDSTRVEAVRLGPLGLADVQALLDSLQLPLPATGDGPGWAQRLFGHAAGQPFYTLETLKAVLLFGPADPRSPLPLPAAAGSLIERRIQQLSERAASLLRWICLAPDVLDRPLVARLSGAEAQDVAAAWSELEQLQLARGALPAHDLVREHVLAQWPEAARGLQARTLAAGLRGLPVEPIRMAALWSQGQAYGEAAACFEQSARAAGRAGRLAEQIELFESAARHWRLAHHETPAFDAEMQAWNAALVARGSRFVLDASERLLARAANARARAQVMTLRANALLNEARFDEALAEAAAALREAGGDPALVREAATLHGQALALTGRAAEALEVLTAALARDGAQDDAQALATLGALAHALQVCGRTGEAMATQQRVRDHALRLGDATQLAQASCNLATLQALCGAPTPALQTARDADRRLEALGARDAHWVYNRITLARCAAHLGRFDEAIAALDAIVEPAAVVGEAMATMVAVIRFGIDGCLGVARPETLPAPDQAGSPLSAAGLVLARLRLLRDSGGADPGGLQRLTLESHLERLALATPGLRDDPVLARDWCRLDAAADAVTRLSRLADHARAVGAPGLARSLDVVRAERLAEIDPDAACALARALLPTLAEGLHPATWPHQAWRALAQVLEDHGASEPSGASGAGRPADAALAASARAQAARWIEEARLPPGVAPEAWRQGHAARPSTRA